MLQGVARHTLQMGYSVIAEFLLWQCYAVEL